MKPRQRQARLLELLKQVGEMDLDEACRRLGGSEATMRRDFVRLTEAGLVERFWGGVRWKDEAPGILGPPAFAQRLGVLMEEKRDIARAAAALLRDGDVVFIDGGTTTYQLCEFLAQKRIRILTNSLAIAHAIDCHRGEQRGAELILSGGILQAGSGLVAGPAAEVFFRRYRADWLFLSAAGIDADGVYNYDEDVLSSEKIMIERAARTVLLLDHSKIGRTAMCRLSSVRKIHLLITSPMAGRSPAWSAIKAVGIRTQFAGKNQR